MHPLCVSSLNVLLCIRNNIYWLFTHAFHWISFIHRFYWIFLHFTRFTFCHIMAYKNSVEQSAFVSHSPHCDYSYRYDELQRAAFLASLSQFRPGSADFWLQSMFAGRSHLRPGEATRSERLHKAPTGGVNRSRTRRGPAASELPPVDFFERCSPLNEVKNWSLVLWKMHNAVCFVFRIASFHLFSRRSFEERVVCDVDCLFFSSIQNTEDLFCLVQFSSTIF